MERAEQADSILGNMVCAIEMLQNCPQFSLLIPEVRVNLVYALPGASISSEVAAIDGRLTNVNGIPHASGIPKFGASDHMARLIIEVRKYDSAINAGINFKCDSEIIKIVDKYCQQHSLLFGWIDRTKEPAEVSEKDGTSMPWKIKQLFNQCGGIPRLFYEGEGWGKEPLFVALGSSATEVADIAIEIAGLYSKEEKSGC